MAAGKKNPFSLPLFDQKILIPHLFWAVNDDLINPGSLLKSWINDFLWWTGNFYFAYKFASFIVILCIRGSVLSFNILISYSMSYYCILVQSVYSNIWKQSPLNWIGTCPGWWKPFVKVSVLFLASRVILYMFTHTFHWIQWPYSHKRIGELESGLEPLAVWYLLVENMPLLVHWPTFKSISNTNQFFLFPCFDEYYWTFTMQLHIKLNVLCFWLAGWLSACTTPLEQSYADLPKVNAILLPCNLLILLTCSQTYYICS